MPASACTSMAHARHHEAISIWRYFTFDNSRQAFFKMSPLLDTTRLCLAASTLAFVAMYQLAIEHRLPLRRLCRSDFVIADDFRLSFGYYAYQTLEAVNFRRYLFASYWPIRAELIDADS